MKPFKYPPKDETHGPTIEESVHCALNWIVRLENGDPPPAEKYPQADNRLPTLWVERIEGEMAKARVDHPAPPAPKPATPPAEDLAATIAAFRARSAATTATAPVTTTAGTAPKLSGRALAEASILKGISRNP